MSAEPCNIAAVLSRKAAESPERIALRCPGGRGADGTARYDLVLSYAQLDARSDAIAAGLAGHGIARGTRTVVMVRPGPEFFLLMFALFKAGAVPVLVDPGIDRRALRQCLAEAEPEAFIGIPLAHAARLLLGWGRRTLRRHVTVGRRFGWRGPTLREVEAAGAGAGPPLVATDPDEVAALLFTSGSTGAPKGVVYRHRHFLAQVDLLRQAFAIEPGGVDLPTFPPFALFDPALGLTSVLPDMDPTRPARADPRRLVQAMERFGVTQLFGSPALLDVLSRHGVDSGARLPGVTRVTSAGAPVPHAVVERMFAMLPDEARLWTPYGATECLPVAVIEGRELLATRAATAAGAGTCVGRPVPPNVVRIIRTSDAPIAEWSDALLAAPGEVGEITVAGPTTTDAYHNRPEATAAAKILERAGGGRIVHRMGDLGYFDAEGRLWFCGRKSQRVQTAQGTLHTEQVEPVFNTHPDVRRSALVGLGAPGRQQPVLCVELVPGTAPDARERIEAELANLAQRHAHTRGIERVLFHPAFPVDIRHNAKIGREQLARWAAAQRAGGILASRSDGGR